MTLKTQQQQQHTHTHTHTHTHAHTHTHTHTHTRSALTVTHRTPLMIFHATKSFKKSFKLYDFFCVPWWEGNLWLVWAQPTIHVVCTNYTNYLSCRMAIIHWTPCRSSSTSTTYSSQKYLLQSGNRSEHFVSEKRKCEYMLMHSLAKYYMFI